MKYIYTLILLFSISQVGLLAQTDVYLTIDHMLGDNQFDFNKMASNNNSQNFTLTRLEYYISEVSLIHDGGQETQVSDLWILADGNSDEEVYLGNFDLLEIEAISFYIGVDPAHNHLDPSAWPSNHPLAPKSPSMHWGWTSGYRFIALEGKTGGALNQVFQLHGLGDDNYWKTSVNVIPRSDKGTLYVDLIADYEQALANINLYSAPISHGFDGEALACLINFNNFVFSNNELVSSTNEERHYELEVFPNPSSTGSVLITIPDEIPGVKTIETFNQLGQLIDRQKTLKNQLSLQFSEPGTKLIRVYSEEGNIATQMLLVK